MATATKLEWTETGMDRLATLSAGRTIIGVADEVVMHYAALTFATTPEDALADYAAGYDAGEPGTPCVVRWQLWQDGRELDRGRHEFTSR